MKSFISNYFDVEVRNCYLAAIFNSIKQRMMYVFWLHATLYLQQPIQY